ncbi:MAG TPA: tetratricopeptide repeat protein [Anaerolineae bacterium]|nr:tetratricopeptide repeat protein [Anaerolineae bacterium]HMR65918.1 tetratricopeptide repeat protein [Anaerolineae bacterium]
MMSFFFSKYRVWLSLVLALLLVNQLSFLVWTQTVSPTEAMSVANDRYESGHYDEATDIYESILEAGIENSSLYYNLGNAYFKQGDLGRAILNYRRAQRFSPRDGDIIANLQIARAQTLDRLEATENSSLTNFVKVAEEWLTLNEAAVIALLLWLLICTVVLVSIVRPKLRRTGLWLVGILGLLLLVGVFSIANRLYNDYTSPSAVVLAEKVDVTSGPGATDQYLVEFELHAGAEVRQLEARAGWKRIALPGNHIQGWVPEKAIELVIKE